MPCSEVISLLSLESRASSCVTAMWTEKCHNSKQLLPPSFPQILSYCMGNPFGHLRSAVTSVPSYPLAHTLPTC